MNTRKTMKAALQGCEREKIAEAIGMTVGSMNNMIAGELPYLPKGKSPNFLDRTCSFIESTFEESGKPVVLEKLAEEYGFLLIPNPAIRVSESPAVEQISGILTEFARFIEEIGIAHEDGRIESYEAENIRAKWETLKRKSEQFVLACETGKFNHQKKG